MNNIPLNRKIRGQAMTETVIAASFVLVPLFLLIPLIGKYIDIHHTTIQAARYEAWEYTVWYRTNAEKPTGVKYRNNNNVPLPTKTYTDLRNESRQRFFSEEAYLTNNYDANTSNITSNDLNNWDINSTNRLWRTHRINPANPTQSMPILDPATSIIDTNNSFANSSDDTPSGITTALFDLVYTVVDTIFTGISSLISWAAPNAPRFDAINLKGYSKSEVSVNITPPTGLLNFRTISGEYGVGSAPAPIMNLSFNSQAAVLSDGWNAGGAPHVINQAGGMVPTKLLNSIVTAMRGNAAVSGVMTAIEAVAPELRPCNPSSGHFLDPDDDGMLWLGYLDTEAIHPDRLHSVRSNGVVETEHIGGGPGNKGHQCFTGNSNGKANICQFEYNVPGNPSYVYPKAINKAGFEDECN
jgi:hypothetical protein